MEKDCSPFWCAVLYGAPVFSGVWLSTVLTHSPERGDAEPFLRALRPLMWRNDKHHVRDEMLLPPQHVIELPLALSSSALKQSSNIKCSVILILDFSFRLCLVCAQLK